VQLQDHRKQNSCQRIEPVKKTAEFSQPVLGGCVFNLTMGEELPENFPEFSIMYKTLSSQIKKLKKEKENLQGGEEEEIQLKIKNYELEIIKIKKKFPNNFFEGLS